MQEEHLAHSSPLMMEGGEEGETQEVSVSVPQPISQLFMEVDMSCLMGALGTELRSSTLAVSAFNCCAISLASAYLFFSVIFLFYLHVCMYIRIYYMCVCVCMCVQTYAYVYGVVLCGMACVWRSEANLRKLVSLSTMQIPEGPTQVWQAWQQEPFLV